MLFIRQKYADLVAIIFRLPGHERWAYAYGDVLGWAFADVLYGVDDCFRVDCFWFRCVNALEYGVERSIDEQERSAGVIVLVDRVDQSKKRDCQGCYLYPCGHIEAHATSISCCFCLRPLTADVLFEVLADGDGGLTFHGVVVYVAMTEHLLSA